ncbi:MAG: DUF3341 domain-containing protein [Flavobacteriaceae bacterium]|jgi:hypothetical protein|nr:DUF3341 domain-containing protein [Candidatus Arcticimaribacter sp.]MDA9638630.1 DUF3341 domain-containing protein [Candidatus Arcticimaribacter sp.]MDO7582009.1 DUF3341 domain-containing protein [Flavobacteriaceae bacterium]MDO7591849.1 DUF3341 domain-containing protein [Flavobacteriaceae bacterium]|tara:strand:+ start:4336 stop:4866 length:531 start_codon:yes stop_codon:yes gene_type:complete
MSNQFIHALYDDDDVLLNAVKEIREHKHHIEEIYTPFPVHGLDKAMGLEGTRIAIMAFIYGCIGLGVAITMINFIMIEDWPQNIGGKPSFTFLANLPAFVPVIFEMTVFFAAHLMVITFYMRSRLWPFKKAENPNPLTTDDKFLMEVKLNGNEKELTALLKKTGAIEITIPQNHEE